MQIALSWIVIDNKLKVLKIWYIAIMRGREGRLVHRRRHILLPFAPTVTLPLTYLFHNPIPSPPQYLPNAYPYTYPNVTLPYPIRALSLLLQVPLPLLHALPLPLPIPYSNSYP